MIVAVTGGTGFVGRSLLPLLLAGGHRPRVLARPGGRRAAPAPGLEEVEGPLDDAATLDRLLAGADALIHLAAYGVQGRDRSWDILIKSNVQDPVALLRKAAQHRVGAVVAAGSYFEYTGEGVLPDALATGPLRLQDEGAPTEKTDAYGATKAGGGTILRALARELGVPLTYLRFAQLLGPGDDDAKFMPSAVRAALAREPFEMTGGEQVREWLHVRDAAATVVACLANPATASGRLLNVGTGEGLRLRDVVERVFELAGAAPALVRAGARPYRLNEPHRLVMDVRRSHALHRAAVGLDEGIAELLASPRRRA